MHSNFMCHGYSLGKILRPIYGCLFFQFRVKIFHNKDYSNYSFIILLKAYSKQVNISKLYFATILAELKPTSCSYHTIKFSEFL